jgi:hypothetical protein
MIRERALRVVLVGIALFGWRLSLNDVSVATEATGYRADDA